MRTALKIIAAILAAAAILAWTGVWLSSPGQPADRSFSVASGENPDRITDRLYERGFIHSRSVFRLALGASGLSTKLQPGVYDLAGVADYQDLIRRLAAGGVAANEFTLLIKEGWNLRDIASRLTSLGYADAKRLFEVTGQPALDYRSEGTRPPDLSADFPFLKDKPGYVSLEGYLFPDTYRVFKDDKAEALVRRLLVNFEKKVVDGLGSDIEASGHTLFDVLTMASIVEREVRGEEDRAMVADIFWRRIDAGMALQADSTVNYATGRSDPSVSLADTDTDSRYNTYKYPDLPLGPICDPGLSAIKATLHPQANAYWFFLTDDKGKVHYAKTLEEHNRNKAKYLH